MKNIAILGSTGSIGTQTLDVARKNEDLRVVAVSAGKSVEKLEEQIREFHPLLAAVWDEKAARDLKTRIADTDTKVVSGMEGLLELASMPESEILVTAIVGMIGIRPTMEGIRAGKDIALANKETLVTAGHLIMPMAKKYGVSILPVDSEHSAIFQAIHGEENKEIHKLLIPRTYHRRAAKGHCCRYSEASKLGNGTKDHRRFRNPGKQRAGSYGSQMAVRHGSGSYSGGGAAAEYHPFHGGV